MTNWKQQLVEWVLRFFKIENSLKTSVRDKIQNVKENQEQTLAEGRNGSNSNNQKGSNGDFGLYDRFMDAAPEPVISLAWKSMSRYKIVKTETGEWRVVTPRTSNKVFIVKGDALRKRNSMMMNCLRMVFIYPWRDTGIFKTPNIR